MVNKMEAYIEFMRREGIGNTFIREVIITELLKHKSHIQRELICIKIITLHPEITKSSIVSAMRQLCKQDILEQSGNKIVFYKLKPIKKILKNKSGTISCAREMETFFLK